MDPLVTVLLPVYRPKLEYLHSAVASVLNQTLTRFELLIVEATSDVSIAALLDSFSDTRVVHHRYTRPASLIGQLNEGLLRAKASLVARMDADDWCFPDRLQHQYDFLKAHPQIAVVGSHLAIMDEHDHPLGYRRYPLDSATIAGTLRRSNALAHPSVMFRKDVILQAGGYHDRTCPANEDYELWCRLTQRGCQLANLDETLLRYRIHAGASKSEKLKKILRGTMRVKRHYFARTMQLGDWARYAAEGMLLNLPGWVILQLFQRWQYRKDSP